MNIAISQQCQMTKPSLSCPPLGACYSAKMNQKKRETRFTIDFIE